MISAAEQHELGCPLPASVVERTESIRRRVAMFISAGTVKTHLAHVYVKLHVANRTELTAALARRSR